MTLSSVEKRFQPGPSATSELRARVSSHKTRYCLARCSCKLVLHTQSIAVKIEPLGVSTSQTRGGGADPLRLAMP